MIESGGFRRWDLGIQAVAIRPLATLGRNPLGDREHVAIAWTL